MKIATWNVNSINIRLEPVLRWIAEEKPDVLCLQEIKCTDEKFPFLDFAEIGYKAVILGQKSYNGVAILSPLDMKNVRYNFPGDTAEAPARLISADIGNIHVVDVYVPNGTELGTDKFVFKLDWLQRLRHYFDSTCDRNSDVLLCGDFNIAPEERDVYDVAAWTGKLHFTIPERASLDYVRRWGFVDLFRQFNENGGQYSWWNYREGAFQRDNGLRIDFIWVSPSLAKKCKRCWIDRDPRTWERPSDHAPVVAEFDV
jgi:exodeoxyribonuclease-3